MLSFDLFVDYVSENILLMLPERFTGATVDVRPMCKPGAKYLGMVVMPRGITTGTIVDLNQEYRRYQKGGSLDDVMNSIAKNVTAGSQELNEMIIFEDYDVAKEQLFLRVNNRVWNKEYLSNMPHHDVEDLAVTVHLKMRKDEAFLGSVPFTYSMMKMYGVEEEQVYHDAMESAKKLFPPTLNPLKSYRHQSELILTNEMGINGAAALWYPGMMEQLAEQFGGNFQVVPLSVHEVIICPDDGKTRARGRQAGLKSAMTKYSEPEIWLSRHIYRYAEKRHCLEILI
ncbi:MAG: hypothetical protein IJ225_09510 [Solobacterium sp.]|nr:hypothetical protein [Solobacterium sp.]